MSAPSAHPNCCARHPSLSSPVCVSPEPTLIHYPNTIMFSPQNSLQGSRGSKWVRVKMCLICDRAWRYINCLKSEIVIIFAQIESSLYYSCDSLFFWSLSIPLSLPWEMMMTVLLLFAMQLLTLPLASLCFDPRSASVWDIWLNPHWHTCTRSTVKHLSLVWCIMNYVRLLHNCTCATARCTILILPSEQPFCCRIYIAPLKNVIMHHLHILYIISNKYKWNRLSYKEKYWNSYALKATNWAILFLSMLESMTL